MDNLSALSKKMGTIGAYEVWAERGTVHINKDADLVWWHLLPAQARALAVLVDGAATEAEAQQARMQEAPRG